MFPRSVRPALLFSLAFASIACSREKPGTDVPMKFHAIQRIPGSQSVAVILTEESGTSFLPLSVDEGQALSIYLGQKHIPSQRPLSHDLMVTLLQTLDATVNRVVITDLRENVYYAEIELHRGKDTVKIDARPSDAIALALRVEAPIFAKSHLLEKFRRTESTESDFSHVKVKTWGITVQDVEGTLRRVMGDRDGVLVTQVDFDSPAHESGLLPGDLILRVDDDPVPQLTVFGDLMAGKKDAAKITMEIARQDSTFMLTLERHN